jgi:signal transduction histidine kinase
MGLKTMYGDSSRENEDLAILISLIQAVHKSSDLEEIYRVALSSAVKLENVDMASIYLVDEEKKREAVLRAHRNLPYFLVKRAGRIPYPIGITWKAINSGKIFNIEDLQKDPDVGPAGRELGPHSALVIPITLEEKAIGVIWFISYREHRFDDREVRLLSTLGDQIAIAVAKAKMLEELRKREEDLKQTLSQLSKKNRYESIISAVTQNVHKTINLQDVLENAVDAMSKNIDNVDNVSIYLVEDGEAGPASLPRFNRGTSAQGSPQAVLEAYRGYPDWWAKRVRAIPYPIGFTWKTIIEGKPCYCADVDKDTVIGPAGRKMGTKSYASMPINFGGKTVGVININSLKKNAFDEEELKLLEIVARKIEVAINNAKQADALRKSEEALRKAKNELEVKVEERTTELRKTNRNLMAEIAERRRAEEELKNSHEKLRALAARLQSIREEERKLIAREVHDELGQALTGLKLDLSRLASGLSEGVTKRNKTAQRVESMSILIDETIKTVRRIATQLRPGVLDDLGLVAAIEWQVQDFRERTGVKCEFKPGVKHLTLDQNLSTALFRILQETLTNIARHANASKVKISLKKDKDSIVLRVEDNGRGITEREISGSKSLGLLGIKERALLFGGSVDITGRQNKGTVVAVHIPLRRYTP